MYGLVVSKAAVEAPTTGDIHVQVTGAVMALEDQRLASASDRAFHPAAVPDIHV